MSEVVINIVSTMFGALVSGTMMDSKCLVPKGVLTVIVNGLSFVFAENPFHFFFYVRSQVLKES